MIRKALSAVMELGVVDAGLYGISRILDRLGTDLEIHRYELVAQPVASQDLLRPDRGRTLVVREVGPGDPALRSMPLTEEIIDFRFAQDCVCFATFKGDLLVAYLWLCFGAYEEDVVRCRFVPAPSGESAWDFDVYIFPQYRVGLAFARLWDEAHAYLRARGIVWTFSRISPFNRQSLNSHRRLDARHMGRALFIRRRSIQIMVATIRPYLHIAGAAGSGPDLHLHPPESRKARGRRRNGRRCSEG